VSAHHLRHEKTCLNCGATVEERFCTRCGQENLEPTETVGHLVRHFFEDLTHFDGKFFVTVKDLIIRPGFLTREYVAGRRMSYLNPIRMYIFISAVFFVVLFAGKEESAARQEDTGHSVNLYRQGLADSLRSVVKTDSLHRSFNGAMADRLDTTEKVKLHDESVNLGMNSLGKVVIDMTENKYNTVREYDSVQGRLPDTARARDKGFMHWLLRHNVQQKEKHGGRSMMHVEVDVSHDIPKIMFVLLPLFALYISWFYSRKQYYYVNHAIFTVHYHCFIFLLFLVFLGLGKLIPGDWAQVILSVLSMLLAFIYLVAALHGMYRQSFWLSLGKAMVFSLLYFITISVANILLGIYAFLSI
jgi:Protein of unknown function (DUF3667)